MKKPFSFRLVSLLILLLTLSTGRAGAQAPAWQGVTNPCAGYSGSTALDAAGNVYITGVLLATTTFGTTTLTRVGYADFFVAKRNSSGTYLWAVSAGSPNHLTGGNSIAVDGSGNVVVTGSFSSDTITLGGRVLVNAGMGSTGSDIFVGKLSSVGVWQWAVRAGGNDADEGRGVAVDGNGNVYVTGSFESNTADFGPTTLYNSSGFYNNMFVAKLSPLGTWRWATKPTGGSHIGFGVAADGSGNVAVTGFFTGQQVADSTRLTSAGGADVFVAMLTTSGVWQWTTRAGGRRGNDFSTGVAIDGGGNVVVVGHFDSDTASFGATTLTNLSGGYRKDGFVAKLTSAGAWQWAVRVGDSRRDSYSTDVAVDGSGSTYVAGNFSDSTVTFGAITLTNTRTDSADIYVAKLTPAGTWQWAVGAGGTGDDIATSVTVASNGAVVVGGVFSSSTATFGATTLINPFGANTPAIFIARLSTTTGLPEATSPPPFTLAPNPTHLSATLTGLSANIPTVALLDALGRVVRTAPAAAGAATLDVRGLPAGLYFVQAGGAVRRLVVE